MEKDMRYESVKVMIEAGHITSFDQIFHYIPKSLIAKELNMNTGRMSDLMIQPEKFTIDKLMTIASVVNVDSKLMLNLVHQQIVNNSKKTKAGSKK